MIRRLADAFLAGKVDPALVQRAREDGFRAFELQRAVGVRPPLLRYKLPLDGQWMRSVALDVARSRDAGKRLGVEWQPRGANAIVPKDRADDLWITREQLKPLDDVCTRWCTRTYFPDAFSRVNMVANVVRLYDALARETGLRFRIVFKGGVMIRLVILEFLHNFHLGARRKAVDYLTEQRGLSMSDFDFEIVPYHQHSPPDLVHRFFLLDYAVLLWLQKQMQREVEKHADGTWGGEGLLSLAWDEDAAREELRRWLQEEMDGLEPSHPLFGATVDRVTTSGAVDRPPKGYATRSGARAPAPRQNVAVFRCPPESSDAKPTEIAEAPRCVTTARTLFGQLGVRGVPSGSGGDRFYATLNTYVGEGARRERPLDGAHGELLSLFHLARIKHAFVLYYTTRDGKKRCDRLGGEMVDLSQGHPTDETHARLFREVPSPYRDYPLLGVDAREVVLHSYTAEGFLFELRAMLHHRAQPPWEVPKSSKRMVRYVAFLLMHTLGPRVPGTHERKMRALHALVEATRSMGALAKPLRTGVLPVDRFADYERRAACEGGRKAAPHVALVHRHLKTLVDALNTPERADDGVLDLTVLRHLDRHYF